MKMNLPLLLSAALLIGSTVLPPSPARANTSKLTLGYYNVYYTGDKTSYNSLNAFSSYINNISTMTFNADASGNVVGTAPADALSLAASRSITSYAAITNIENGAFSGSLGRAIISDPAIRSRTITNILNLLKTAGYKGANVDFENLLAADRPYYNQFISELSSTLRANGFKTMVSVVAKSSDSPTVSWLGAYDYASLGQSADLLQIMTYDQNGPWSTPGPVSGYNWVEGVLKFAVTQAPSTKILMGLPAYGYDWNTTTNAGHKAVSWKNTPALISSSAAVPQWDAAAQSPYIKYTAGDGSQHTFWYENQASITAKAQLANKYNLAGVSMWSMRLEDESFWKAVQSGLQTTTVTTATTAPTTTTTLTAASTTVEPTATTAPTTTTTTTDTAPTTTTTTDTAPTATTTTTATAPTTTTTTTATAPTTTTTTATAPTTTTTTATAPTTTTTTTTTVTKPALMTTLSASKTAYTTGQTVYLTSKVTDSSGKPLAGAAITLSVTSPTGMVTKYTGTTDAYGTKTFTIYTTKKSAKGVYRAASTAALVNYTGASAAASYTLQ